MIAAGTSMPDASYNALITELMHMQTFVSRFDNQQSFAPSRKFAVIRRIFGTCEYSAKSLQMLLSKFCSQYPMSIQSKWQNQEFILSKP